MQLDYPEPHQTPICASDSTDWRSRVITGDRLGAVELFPAWLASSYQTMREQVMDDAYPCFFGTQAERRGEMFYAFVEGKDTRTLAASMRTFAALASLPAYEKNNIAVFFEPDTEPLGHQQYHDLFWRTLQQLHEADRHPHADEQLDPSDPAWEFCYAGVEMFVVCACPSFMQRHSRNLGPGMVLLFQPRSVFIDKITNKVIGRRAREQVRARLRRWDTLEAHPDLGFYGEPGNLEWKQYFLPDHNTPHEDRCPFLRRHAAGQRSELTDIVAVLRRHAAAIGDKLALQVLADGETVTTSLDYATLDRHVRALAGQLQAQTRRGERAMLLLPSGVDFVVAFFACLYAGIVAVPAYPPEAQRNQHMERLRSMFEDCRPSVLLCRQEHHALLQSFIASGDAATAAVIAPETVRAAPEAFVSVAIDGADIAFLQYTSGSTSTPKGVMVSHAAIIANERAQQAAMRTGADDLMVSWLPLYHDMGLLGGLLAPIYVGFALVLLPTPVFLAAPIRWLKAVSQFRATISGGPDFAFQLCLDRTAQRDLGQLDLGSWRVAFSGAEPIRLTTMEAFAERYGQIGFRRESLYACYGLAEATLLVTGASVGEGPRAGRFDPLALAAGRATESANGHSLVACGTVQASHALRIVDPSSGAELDEGHIGEIQVAGPSLASGYWGRSEASAETFVEQSGDGAAPTRWLRTGDLGFLYQGQLYISGRLKDLIIIRGQNIYPQDIESLLERQVAGLRKGRIAAFAARIDDEESIGIAAELSRTSIRQGDGDEVLGRIIHAVADAYQVQVGAVALLQPGALPRTSSGKLRRGACASGWRDGTLATVLRYARARDATPWFAQTMAQEAMDDTESAVADLWRDILGRRPTTPMADFIEHGGDSLSAMRLAASLGRHFGLALPGHFPFAERSLRAQAASLRRSVWPSNTFERPREDATPSFPLTSAQQGLWFLWRLNPRSPAYNVSASMSLNGSLDTARLRLALRQVLARHAMLRTRFVDVDGVPRQYIDLDADRAVDWREDDLRLAPNAASELCVRLRARGNQAFDLAGSGDGLLRVSLVRLADERHVVQLCTHHIVADAWSLSVLREEWRECYVALRQGRSPRLAPSPMPFGELAERWQARQQASMKSQIAYWRTRLGDTVEPLELPLDHPRPARRSTDAERLVCALPEELRTRIHALSARVGATPFVIMLAAFAVLLQRLSGQASLRIGVPLSRREPAIDGDLVGYLVNTVALPLSLDVADLASLLAQVQQRLAEAREHGDVPFAQLLEAMPQARDPSRTPLCQVLFNQSHGFAEQDWDGLRVAEFDEPVGRAHYDLCMHVVAAPHGMKLMLDYATVLFEPSTMTRWLSDYLELLRSLTEEAALNASLPLASVPERVEESARSIEFRSIAFPFVAVTARIAAQAARRPHAEAITDGGRRLDYRTLERWSNRIAAQLVDAGLGAESKIGVHMQRAASLVAALLGVLKAGAAYVPLDPAHPLERLREVADDAGLSAIIADDHSHKASPSLFDGRRTVLADALDPAMVASDAADEGFVPRTPDPRQLAYVIYTSGSTGRPKGVGVTHRNIARLFDATESWYRFDEHDVWPLFHAYAFDVSVWEWLGALVHGGRLVIVPARVARDATAFHALLRQQRVTVLNQTPSAFMPLMQVDLAASERLDQLRLIVFAGEKFEPAALARWHAACRQGGAPMPRIVNMYGITETTVHVTYRAFDPDEIESAAPRSLIGLPMPDLDLHLLDRTMLPATPGGVGALYVGGDGVARGYLGRPGLTAEHFVPDPHGLPGSRLYASGDLARRLPHGELEYIGRSDQQVKIRGYRVEPGELQAALYAHPLVREAAVLAVDDPASESARLVAYVAPAQLDTRQVLADLAMRLPSYLLPSLLLTLDALPLTVNGKLDRHALPAPRRSANQDAPALSPRSTTERAIARVWAQVLAIEPPGLNDDFFALGGHSLLALRTASRLGEALGRDIPLELLFDHSRLGALAAILDATPPAAGGQAVSALIHRSLTRRGHSTAPLSFAQERLWILWKLDPASTAYHMTGTLQCDGPLDAVAARMAFEQLVARHESLRTRFVEHDGEPCQQILADAVAAYRWRQLDASEIDEKDCAQRLRAEALEPFDLERDALLRITLARQTAQRHLLHLVLHHIVADGWSIDILLREFAAFYRAARRAEAAALEPLPLQYADYAAWQRRRFADGGERLRAQLDYWRGRLAGLDAPLELPTEHDRGRPHGTRGGSLSMRIESALAARAQALATARGATLFMLLLAVFDALLYRYSGCTDVAVAIPVAGRERRETEGLIGFFVNTLVQRAQLSGALPFVELLRQVREDSIGAQANSELPFDRLVAELQPRRRAWGHPFAQVKFLLQDAFDTSHDLDGVHCRLLEAEAGDVRFELALDITRDAKGLACRFDYAAELYDEDFIVPFARDYVAMLTQVVEQPQRRIGTLQLNDADVPGDAQAAMRDTHANHASSPGPAASIQISSI